jgi:hypothetical protein
VVEVAAAVAADVVAAVAVVAAVDAYIVVGLGLLDTDSALGQPFQGMRNRTSPPYFDNPSSGRHASYPCSMHGAIVEVGASEMAVESCEGIVAAVMALTAAHIVGYHDETVTVERVVAVGDAT